MKKEKKKNNENAGHSNNFSPEKKETRFVADYMQSTKHNYV
jgi:hypothetical protein